MNPGTRTRLEMFLERYSRARRRRLRMLVGITKEELDWQPAAGIPSAGELVRSLAKRRGRMTQRDLDALTEREITVTAQVDLLCRLRLALSAQTARPIPPGRAGHAVPQRKSPARKASV